MNTFLILVCVAFIVGCAATTLNNNMYSSSIVVVDDQTDPILAHPMADPILESLSLSEHRDASVEFRYKLITDKVLVPETHIILPNEEDTKRLNVGNESLFREKIILSFYDSVRNCFSANRRSSDTSHYKYSECFRSISDALMQLSKTNASKKTLLIFSNLLENSSLYDCYSAINMAVLQANPAKVVKLFEATHLLPSRLDGIKVIFIFQAESRDVEHKFLSMISVYRMLLEERGAIIHVQADNKNYVI